MKKLYTIAISAFLMSTTAQAQGWARVGDISDLQRERQSIKGLCYDNGTLYARSYETMLKWSGAGWEMVGSSFAGKSAIGTTCADSKHNIYTIGVQNAQRMLTVLKWDGTTWSELGAGIPALHTVNDIHTLCVDKDDNVCAAGAFRDTTGAFYVAKWDGTSWSQLGTGSNALKANSAILALAADSHGNIYAAGQFKDGEHIYVAKWDGTSWSKLGSGDNPLGYVSSLYYIPYIISLYVDVHDNVYAGGEIENASERCYVAKWDGTAWSQMAGEGWATGLSYAYGAETITGDKAGNVYVAGRGVGAYVEDAGSSSVKKWNGNGWEDVGGVSMGLNAQGVVETICTDTSGGLYAGGDFADGTRPFYQYRSYIAKFDTRDTRQVSLPISMTAWPNPAKSTMTVDGPEFGQYIYVCDMMGAARIKAMNRWGASAAKPVIDVSDLPAGVYFLRSHNCIPFVFTKQ